ncbi:hypothetical protein N7474_006531 [Penicillium riverlandense]|uniref:uncharacterized protein n=1 Tax=Penicillium riverlandense TaxID=1903569 RepID=UPI002546F575|nr:uncharacterized protein N7474_006531 [Penicillium riverlandense]KAJ5814754.1 hypothetical protein N7474_006531 [Penicillium riverlandense]
MGFTMRMALTASTLFLAAAADSQYVACYDNNEGLTNETSYNYQSQGWCQTYCMKTNAAVFAMTGGSDCLCGDELPPESGKVSDSRCNTKCDGWPSVMCGGPGVWSVWLTGLESHVPSEGATTTKSGSSTQETDQSATSSSQPEEVTVTQSAPAQTDGPTNSSSSHNTAAIAAGVVVGVVGLAALIGAAFFFYRHKKNKEEAEFGNGIGDYDTRAPPMTDSRFDGTSMAQRRQSNGSIDENHDFSRRILQVSNPDHY